MAAKAKSDATHHSEALKQVTYLASALKAPRITEVAARNASGAQLRIRAAGFPARKTIEGDAQPAVRQQIAALASGGFHRSPQRRAARSARHRHDPPGHRTGHRSSQPRPPSAVRDRHRVGHPAHRRPPPDGSHKNSPGYGATA